MCDEASLESSDRQRSSSAALFNPRCLDRAAAYRMLYMLKSHLQRGTVHQTLVRHRGLAGTKRDAHSLDRLSECVWMLFCKAWSVGRMAADLHEAHVLPWLQSWKRSHKCSHTCSSESVHEASAGCEPTSCRTAGDLTSPNTPPQSPGASPHTRQEARHR